MSPVYIDNKENIIPLKNFDSIDIYYKMKAGNFDKLFEYTNISTETVASFKYAYKIFKNQELFEHIAAHANDLQDSNKFIILACKDYKFEALRFLIESGVRCTGSDIISCIRSIIMYNYRDGSIVEYLLSIDSAKDASKEECRECLSTLCNAQFKKSIHLFLNYLEDRPDCQEIISAKYSGRGFIGRMRRYRYRMSDIDKNLVNRMINLGASKKEGKRLIFEIEHPFLNMIIPKIATRLLFSWI